MWQFSCPSWFFSFFEKGIFPAFLRIQVRADSVRSDGETIASPGLRSRAPQPSVFSRASTGTISSSKLALWKSQTLKKIKLAVILLT